MAWRGVVPIVARVVLTLSALRAARESRSKASAKPPETPWGPAMLIPLRPRAGGRVHRSPAPRGELRARRGRAAPPPPPRPEQPAPPPLGRGRAGAPPPPHREASFG